MCMSSLTTSIQYRVGDMLYLLILNKILHQIQCRLCFPRFVIK